MSTANRVGGSLLGIRLRTLAGEVRPMGKVVRWVTKGLLTLKTYFANAEKQTGPRRARDRPKAVEQFQSRKAQGTCKQSS